MAKAPKAADIKSADALLDRDEEMRAAALEAKRPDAADDPQRPPEPPRPPETWQEEAALVQPDLVEFFPYALANLPTKADDVIAARRSMQDGFDRFLASGHLLIAEQFENVLKKLSAPLPVAPAAPPAAPRPKAPEPAKVPRADGAARPVLATSTLVGQVKSLHPAKRPHLREREEPASMPDLADEFARMQGHHPAKRPDLRVPSAGLMQPSTDGIAPLVVRRAPPPDVPIVYVEVLETRVFRAKEGQFELTKGSVISSQTHDLDALRVQGFLLQPTAAPRPIKLDEEKVATIPAGIDVSSDPLATPSPEGAVP